MKKKYCLLVLFILPLLMSHHDVWMQMKAKGSVGSEATIHLYNGSMDEGTRKKGVYDTEKFKYFKAFVKAHGEKNMQPVDLKPSEKSLFGKITPKKPGIYQVVAYNDQSEVRDLREAGLGRTKSLIYLRTVFEAVKKGGRQEGELDLRPMMKYDIIPLPDKSGYGDSPKSQPTWFSSTWKVDKPVFAKFYIDSNPAENKEIEVHSPDGWTSTFKTDEDGVMNFTPYKKGTYMLFYYERQKIKGTHKGKDFDTVGISSILTLNVL